MNSGGFDISSLAGARGSPGNSTPPSFVGPGHVGSNPHMMLPNIPMNVPPQGMAQVPQPGFQVAMDATNTLASSVNLSSIQSLVDLLVELPLPAESAGQVRRQEILLTDHQQQHHVTNNLQLGHQNSHQQSYNLAAAINQPLRNARQQLAALTLNWKDRPGTDRPPAFSEKHLQNSNVLAVLHQKDSFNAHVVLPPAPHHLQPPLPHAQPQPVTPGQQHWSPWDGQPHSQPVLPQQGSPYVASSPVSAQAYGRQANHQMYPANDNSNSNSSSFSSDVAHGTSPGHSHLPQAQPFVQPHQHHQTHGVHPGVHNNHHAQPAVLNAHPQFAQPTVHVPLQSSAHNSPMHPPPQPQQHHIPEAMDPSNYVNNNSIDSKEPMIMLDKLDMTQYYSEHLGSYSSLGDRVKSNKRERQRADEVTPTKKERKEKRERESSEKKRRESETKSERLISSPPKKVAKFAAPMVKANASSFSTSYTSSHSLTSNETPQLVSQSSSLPAPEKLNAMLEELFDLGKVKGGSEKSKKYSSSEEEDSDDESRHKKGNKINGESKSASALFNITISGSTLAHLVAITAKLKRNNQMQNMSVSKMTNLLTVLTQQLDVQSAGLKDKRRKSSDDHEDEDDEDTNITTSASMMQKFESCCDCCCVALYILSSKGMASRVYLEECIEQTIAFLNSTIQQFTTIGAACSSASPSKKKSPKKANHYISPTTGANKKILAKMYTKWSELIGLLVEMLSIRQDLLTDNLVISSTRLALGAFFLENLSPGNSALSSSAHSNEIQLNALKLTTTIFSQYTTFRGSILEELLQSIARLPTSKRGRVSYKVESDDGASGSISMFSALLLQLIQSLFIQKDSDNKDGKSKEEKATTSKQTLSHNLKQQYDAALRVAFTFLSTFLRKCCGISVGGQPTSSSDSDYRVLFEGLVSDLMTTLHKPNWPSSQLLTQVLIKILIGNIRSESTKNVKGAGGGGASAQLNLRLASLDHLGTIISRFAKELSDVEKIKNDVKTSLTSILNGDNKQPKVSKDDDNPEDEEPAEGKKKKGKRKNRKGSKDSKDPLDTDVKMEKEIWKHLIRYCDEEKLQEEKNLFVAIWIKEKEREAEIEQQQLQANVDSSGCVQAGALEACEQKIKQFMFLYNTAANPNMEDEEYHVIDSKTAESIIRYLDVSQTTTVKLFDIALAHVIAALSTTANTTMRSRAMKSLSTILNNAHRAHAATLLARTDLQRATRAALLDTSTSVREATIDLIGKFILNGDSEDLIDNYYDIITDRLLDTGVSVRKRVIKILREICTNFPSYKRVPEICSRIIKRVNDDGEGIRKLVTETFQSMWFKEDRDKEAAKLKVDCINNVVATGIKDPNVGTDWLQQLLTNMFATGDKKKVTDEDDEDKVPLSVQQRQQVKDASAQIIDVIIGEVLCGDQQTVDKNSCLAAMTTIWLFSKVCPELMLNHVSTLQPYLTMKCVTQGDLIILKTVVQILELVLPKLPSASPAHMTRIEEDLTKNILQSNQAVLPVCVSCLSSLIHKHTKNNRLAQEIFTKFFTLLDGISRTPELWNDKAYRARLLRSLFTCGLFAKHFEFLDKKAELCAIFVKFINENRATPEHPQARDMDVLKMALQGIGFMFERNPHFCMKPVTQEIYTSLLRSDERFPESYRILTTTQVLSNLIAYLSDEYNNDIFNKMDWAKEDLKSMTCEEGDSNSVQSQIIQFYLADVLRCTLSPLLAVRSKAVSLIHIIHDGGHSHPVLLVPYLIAMSSDDCIDIHKRADHVLKEIEQKYKGFVAMKSKAGVHLAYQLHSQSGRRGYRIENINQSAAASSSTNAKDASTDDKLITGRLSTLYSVVANSRQSRRAFAGGLLKYFETGAPTNSMNDLMVVNSMDDHLEDPGPIQQFVCDNIVWLPYAVWDEPLFLLQQFEVSISILASTVQGQFKDVLNLQEDDDDELEREEAKKNAAAKAMSSGGDAYSGETNGDSQMDTGAGGDAETGTSNNFNCDLRSYLPRPMPSILGTVELVKTLKAFYMLSWTRHLLRELYNITDLKLQDYSPNEKDKVYEKPVHRRTVDTRILDTLMAYPQVNIDPEKFDDKIRERLLEEYQRFKNHQLSGVDSNSKGVAQILRELPPKAANVNHKPVRVEELEPESLDIPMLSREAEEELIERMRNHECSVMMTDISTMDIDNLIKTHTAPPVASNDVRVNNAQMPSASEHQSLKMTISVNAKKKKSKKEKKRKKKKKHRQQRIESSDEDSNESDSPGDSDDDPSYA